MGEDGGLELLFGVGSIENEAWLIPHFLLPFFLPSNGLFGFI